VRADAGYALDGRTMASAADPNPDHERRKFVCWSAVIEAGGRTLLVDTGPPPTAETDWPNPLYAAFEAHDAADRSLAADLGDAGYDVDAVDAVVMTHLHLDHAGELDRFAGTGTPVYVHRRELPYAFFSAHTTEGSIAHLASDFDAAHDWTVVRGREHSPAPGVRLLHLPGHTPGLLGVRVDTPDGTVLLAGDESYVEANYAEGVPMGPGLLRSERDWRESRARLREVERRTDADVVFGHDLDAFRVLPTRWG